MENNPKGESDPTPEEKLLKAIFGDKAGDVKDASLKARPSFKGIVIDKKLFSKSIKDKKTRALDKEKVEILEKEFDKKTADLKSVLVSKLFSILSGKTSQGLVSNLGDELIPKGVKFTLKALQSIDYFSLNNHKSKWVIDKSLNKIQNC